MAKRNSSASKSQTNSQSSKGGITSKVEEITEAVEEFAGGFSSRKLLWTTGALALGAAAVGAYVYRETLMAMYQKAVGSSGTTLRDKIFRADSVVSSTKPVSSETWTTAQF